MVVSPLIWQVERLQKREEEYQKTKVARRKFDAFLQVRSWLDLGGIWAGSG